MEPSTQPLALWGGVECTINRVQDFYFHQLEFSGHARRDGDIEQLAELGIRTLRFPLLWESAAPHSLEQIDWSWADARLAKLRELGIRPIVGLLHHGSGPRYTSLIDPAFPAKLARFAAAVAQRYPWIDIYTPVNEPLTTARFSGLYGHWYPHGRDEVTFTKALLNEVRGTVAAMRAIRQVNSSALLLQTEDLGRVFSTPKLRYQADFENERRWLTWDLLAGLVRPGHAMWHYLTWAGITPNELEFFADLPCSADILGINYYVTSERYLDHKIDNYPPELHGSNSRERYADDAAVRTRPEGLAGVEPAITEAWRRYHSPIAMTEVHLGCTVDEQIRWFMEIWDGACAARAGGADVRGVTAWALLGSFDWNTLVTRAAGHYEPGAFDVSGDELRATALAGMLRTLARGHRYHDPLLHTPGWWRQSSRLRFPELATAA